MLDKLFPQPIDNTFRGYKAALWIFGLVIALRAVQSVMIIFNGYTTVRDADGIPLDTYSPDIARTIVALFALVSLWRLIFCLIGLIVLIRYRAAVSLMFLVLLVHYFAAQLLTQFHPLIRVGTPPGPMVNLTIFALILIGLTLSLAPRRTAT
jgi:hypothetical protein